MRLKTIFKKLLGLQGARVREVELTADEVVVDVARQGGRHRCPRCSFSTRAGYDRSARRWRHVSLGRWRVMLQGELVRLACPTHGVITELVPWAEHDSKFTRDFEDLVGWLTRQMSQAAVTRLVHIAWATVGNIVERVARRYLNRGRLSKLYRIGLDEVSYRKGHKYLTVVADHDAGAAVWAGEGRSKEALGAFFDELGSEACARIEVVTLDMSGPYIAEVVARVPQAQLAFDPFHVVKLANEAVHEVRRSDSRDRKGSLEAKTLKGARWVLLKVPENLRPDEKVQLQQIARINRGVYRAYLLKEQLRALYHGPVKSAARHLDAWLAWASRSKLKPFVKLARTLRKHRAGVLAAVELGLSNGRLEGINNKIGVIKHRAYGFHSAAALISMIYLCCTGMVIPLPV